jgi:hypothetical protein
MYARSYGPSHRARRAHDDRRRHVIRHARRQRAHGQFAHRHFSEVRRIAGIGHGKYPANDPRNAGEFETTSFSRHPVARVEATKADAAGGVTRRAVCVRTCDGYSFPAASISRNADIPARQASCERLCPGAQATLFVMPGGSEKIEEAKAAKGGETLAHLLARLDQNDARARSCSCQTEASAAEATSAVMKDATLRPGDTVVTPQGVRVLKRGSHYPFKSSDFLSLAETRDAPLSTRSALYAIERAMKTPLGRLAVTNIERRRHNRQDWEYGRN